jgi:RimJ/RimL family protein N-acetyltransferase
VSDDASRSPLPRTEPTGFGLRLRVWTAEDLDPVLRGMNDPAVRRWNASLREPLDEAGARAYLRSRAEGRDRGDQAHFCVEDAGTGQALGGVGLHRIDPRRETGGIGYWVLPAARGRGVATRAVELCTRWAFEEAGLHRIQLDHVVQNGASCRVALRSGYLPEGVARGALPAVEPGGHYDVHVHARLATDPAP